MTWRLFKVPGTIVHVHLVEGLFGLELVSARPVHAQLLISRTS